MVKDPWWLYAYWEIQPSTERAARSQLQPQEAVGLQTILRIYDVTGLDVSASPVHQSFDISLSGLATNWFIHTDGPNRSFIADLGLRTTGGRFLLLARSNRVTTPRFGPSEVIDEAWSTTDELYWKLFGPASGIGSGASPGGWAQLLTRQLSSGHWASGSFVGQGRASIVRGFWCRVHTDLVIHGATEPRAQVLIQGQPVVVRKDGTFSLRVALPEGTQTIAIEVTSPDGQQTKTVTPLVTLGRTGTFAPDAGTPRASRAPRPRQRPGLTGGGGGP